MAFIYDNIKIGIIDVVLFTFSLFFALLPRKNTIFAMCFRRNTDFLLNSPSNSHLHKEKEEQDLIIVGVCALAQTSP